MSRPTVLERFWANVDKTDDCWLWTGTLVSGYARFKIGETGVRVHRWSYENFVGPIPEGLGLDHTCHTRAVAECPGGVQCVHRRCVNPAHLEPVTQLVNVHRGALMLGRPRGSYGPRTPRTHCFRGHEFTPENTIHDRAARACRICRQAWQREYSRRKKAA